MPQNHEKSNRVTYNRDMFYSFTGTVAEKTDKSIVLSFGKVCYEFLVSLLTRESITVGQEATLYAWLRFRQNNGDLELYGFATRQEKQMFMLLTSVNKIGPKIALNILSATTLSKLQMALSNKKVDFLTDVLGLSEKTATRLVLELSRKIKHLDNAVDLEGDLELEEELASLGFQKKDIRRVIDKLEGAPHNTSDRLKLALKMLKST